MRSLKHAYFGTGCVVSDLRNKVNGWNDGIVRLQNIDIHRDESSGEICNISQSQPSFVQVVQ